MSHESDRPVVVPSGLYPTDKTLESVWIAQRAQAGQLGGLLHASGNQAKELRRMKDVQEEQDRRIDGLDRTITRWAGIAFGLTVAIQIVSVLWSHLGK